jgi:hypothetical protein
VRLTGRNVAIVYEDCDTIEGVLGVMEGTPI